MKMLLIRSIKLTTTALLIGAAIVTMSASSILAQGTAESDSSGVVRVINTPLAWEKIGAAREASSQDRHHEAVSYYLEALSYDARLVSLVAQELAYQKLWREDAEKSIFYFRRYMRRHPNEENRDIRKGLATALSWSGRQPEAVSLYRELVAEDPSDGSARVGLSRSLVWNNQLKESWTEIRQIEADYAKDTAPGREGRDLALLILDSYTPPLELKLEGSWDSDDLDILRLSGVGSFTVGGNKLLQAMAGFGRYQQPGQADISNPRIGAAFHAALAHNWALHSFLWLNNFSSSDPLFGSPEKLDWTRLGGDLWLTWIATPRLRIDFGGTSVPVETFFALNNKIHYEQANLSADYRLGRHFKAGVSGNYADYSDGNSKRKGMARLTWVREGRWEMQVGPVFNYMDFAISYPGGYWSPNWVRNGSVEATVKTRSEHWTWRLNGSIGLEQEANSESVTVGGASARAGWRFTPDWLLALEVGHSRSSFSAASGFNRTFASLSARAFF
ncbi:MAG: hypothetical protein ACI9UK_000476 [Candidatus Krumholzibacteriia bacterium]|jgi:hypothetical protein